MVMEFSSLMYDESAYAKDMRQNYFQQRHHMFLDRYVHNQECFPEFNVNKIGGKSLGNYYDNNHIIDINSFLTNRHHELRGFDSQVYYRPNETVYNSKQQRPVKEKHQKMETVYTAPNLSNPMLKACDYFSNKKFYEKF